ncbi:MAG: prenyltransferase/squalene oxidase repeat-containing protein [Jatrophihabitans sp.]
MSSFIRRHRRTLGAAVAAVSVATLSLTAIQPANAATTLNTTTGASYLVKQLVDGDHYEPFGPGFGDKGLTIDGLFALAATGGHAATVAKIAAYTAKNGADYSFVNDNTYFTGGAVAKVALAAEVAGQNPRKFGGINYISALTSHECTATSADCYAVGAYQGVSAFFGQALALLALLRADVAPSAEAVAALLALVCPAGGFTSMTSACTTDAGADPDSTALAAMALQAVGGHTAEVGKALSSLSHTQNADGSWDSATKHSTNSTGLAIQALSLETGTYSSQISKARTFLADRQNKDGGVTTGNDPDYPDSDLRASTQAIGGYVGTSFATLVATPDPSPPPTHPAATQPTAKTAAAHAAAKYLVTQLNKGDHVESAGFVDYGLTSDIAIALLADGTQDATLVKVVAYLTKHVEDYADVSGAFGGPFSGSLAKLAIVAELSNANPHSFGGVDLLKQITTHVCTKSIPVDQFGGTPCTAAGDVYNGFSGISQALAVLALQRAHVGLTATSPVVHRLIGLQCTDGGFSSELPPSTPCKSDVDATGFASQALSLAPGTSAEFSKAEAFLVTSQAKSGAFSGVAGVSSNSTALAIQGALAATGTTGQVTRLHSFAPRVQQLAPIKAASLPAAQAGLIRKALPFLTGIANADGGVPVGTSGASDARATAQVVPSLLLASLATSPGRTPHPASSGGTTTGGTGDGDGDPSGHPGLAATGTDAHQLSGVGLLGLALLLVGAGLLVLARRREETV